MLQLTTSSSSSSLSSPPDPIESPSSSWGALPTPQVSCEDGETEEQAAGQIRTSSCLQPVAPMAAGLAHRSTRICCRWRSRDR
eukprot:767083-Hanusia_phi.AAC.2